MSSLNQTSYTTGLDSRQTLIEGGVGGLVSSLRERTPELPGRGRRLRGVSLTPTETGWVGRQPRCESLWGRRRRLPRSTLESTKSFRV